MSLRVKHLELDGEALDERRLKGIKVETSGSMVSLAEASASPWRLGWSFTTFLALLGCGGCGYLGRGLLCTGKFDGSAMANGRFLSRGMILSNLIERRTAVLSMDGSERW
jgi:hypothetical protein